MRAVLALWLAPVAFVCGWYTLSLADLGGILSREMHDRVLALYGEALGVDADLVPLVVAKAFAVDGLLVLAFVLLRRFLASIRAGAKIGSERVQRSEESLSSAP